MIETAMLGNSRTIRMNGSLAMRRATSRPLARNATVRAKGRLVALRIAKDPFMRMVREFPNMAVSIMQELAHRVQSTNSQLQAALNEVRQLRQQSGAHTAA